MTLYRLPRRRSLWEHLAGNLELSRMMRQPTPMDQRLQIFLGTLPGVVFHVCPDCWPGTKGPNVIESRCKPHALGGGDAA